MPFYENVFVARQDLTPAKVTELTEKFVNVSRKNGEKEITKHSE